MISSLSILCLGLLQGLTVEIEQVPSEPQKVSRRRILRELRVDSTPIVPDRLDEVILKHIPVHSSYIGYFTQYKQFSLLRIHLANNVVLLYLLYSFTTLGRVDGKIGFPLMQHELD